MTSEPYVWTWLQGATQPVVAGRVLADRHENLGFVYGQSYLARADAMALGPDLPLRRGPQFGDVLDLPATLRDACPDAWGQRVIRHRLSGDADGGDPGWTTYMLQSGSNRIGALDFQESATTYVPRDETAPLHDLLDAADRINAGEPLDPHLEVALGHGTSIGGARPKVLIEEHGVEYIAKFGMSDDPYPVVKYEAVAMDLARRCGLDASSTRLERVGNRDVLLVRRFDRSNKRRRHMVSGLTMLGLDEMTARYATYPDILDVLDSNSVDNSAGERLLHQIAVNIAVSNSDDHARNIAAFWDGRALELTPAYDICPGPRSGETATQAMAYGRNGQRTANLSDLIDCCEVYRIDRRRAGDIVDHVVETIRSQWDQAADAAELTSAERTSMLGRQILNQGALRGLERQGG